MKTVAIIQARIGSTRLPGKTLMSLGGLEVLGWVIRAAKAIVGVDQVVVATSTSPEDKAIIDYCKSHQIDSYAGDLENVLSRMYHAAKEYKADTVIRLTADCPFLDPDIVGTLLVQFKKSGADYCSNTMVPTWPDGLDAEIFKFSALHTAHESATLKFQKEHVTPFIYHNRQQFKTYNYVCPIPNLQNERWTLDQKEDFDFLNPIALKLKNNRPPRYLEILEILEKQSELKRPAHNIQRNEGYAKSIKEIEMDFPKRTFKKSTELLQRAEKVIPLGSQTFSKSRTQFPPGFAPLYVTHGLGSHIWDVDGNEYVDMINALMPSVLGYCDQDVDSAIRDQLNHGITLSLATDLEVKLAEKLVEIIPCAESVRFGKNGSDATTACIRLARAFTGRSRVMACGYHGWQDWYIGSTTRNKGIPKAVQDLTTVVPYNDLEVVERIIKQYPGEFACLIMEPMNLIEPKSGYLADLKALLHKHNILLIFDEVITGFRYSIGGAQEYFNVTPDLASFGKSLGNGMPIAAVTGRADIMKEMEETFISTTFGGETLSLAASLAVIEKMQREPVIEHLWKMGATLTTSVEGLLEKYSLNSFIQLKGKDPWKLFVVQAFKENTAEALKTFFICESLQRGVLTLGSHNMCYAHSIADLTKVISSYDQVFKKLRQEIDLGNVETRMEYPAIKPLFKVR